MIAYVLGGLLGFAEGRSWAGDSDRDRETLRGLHGLEVLVADLKPDLERAGLTQQQLQTDVAGQLRQAGIPLLTSAERVHVPGKPFLAVTVHVVPRADGLLAAYAITVEVYQVASLEFEAFKATVATWSVGATGSIGLPLLDTLRHSVKDAVAHFIDAYLSVNPRPVGTAHHSRPPVAISCARSRNAYRLSGLALGGLMAAWDPRPSKHSAASRTPRACGPLETSTNPPSMLWAYSKLPACQHQALPLDARLDTATPRMIPLQACDHAFPPFHMHTLFLPFED